ncbi:MAG: hypothetical protein KJZ86_10280 [Caldilineaceae bacterium]|nr:hypothetical protein [Caldilineaceae bacterium]
MKSSNRSVIILTGVLAGAFLGGIFAWMASKREGEDENAAAAALGPSDYFQLGISVLTLARQFGAMLNKG